MMLRLKALGVHLFTATGAIWAVLALLAAVDGDWSTMFVWLIVAMVVDGIDDWTGRAADRFRRNVVSQFYRVNGYQAAMALELAGFLGAYRDVMAKAREVALQLAEGARANLAREGGGGEVGVILAVVGAVAVVAGVVATGGAAVVAAENAERLRVGHGAGVVATLDDRPVGTGGLEIAGTDARLYGGGVRPSVRGRGVYRALLRHRLAYAVEHGATVAITRGRVATSAPVLRRAGFEAFGSERTYRIPLR